MHLEQDTEKKSEENGLNVIGKAVSSVRRMEDTIDIFATSNQCFLPTIYLQQIYNNIITANMEESKTENITVTEVELEARFDVGAVAPCVVGAPLLSIIVPAGGV
jgi:hypothetical protein